MGVPNRPKTWTFSNQGLGAFLRASGNTHHSLGVSAQEIDICTQEDDNTTNDLVTLATQAPPSSPPPHLPQTPPRSCFVSIGWE